jgi:hypothetical protein
MSRRLAPVACLLLALSAPLALWGAAAGRDGEKDKADPFERIKAVAPPLPAARLDVKDYDVSEWVLGPQRQRDRKPIKAKSLCSVGPWFYAEEEGTGRWLVGRKAGDRGVECDTQFAGLQEMLDAHGFAPLPKPPDGFTLREVARLPAYPSRLASDGTGKVLYVLGVNGDVWRLEPATGDIKQILWGDRYLDPDCPDRMLVGMTLDRKGRLYLVANQRDEKARPVTNRVVIFRTTETTAGGDPAAPKPWLKTSYPWGIGPFNHGVGHIAFGPDGKLYVNSGSRTDGDEPGNDDRYSKEGETPLTACIWRLDPDAEDPQVEVYARGLRNAYGFCWNDKGEMYATDNGPDADPPEELNRIEAGKHYGFPYRFSDWGRKPYPYTPDSPPGLDFVKPVANLGPDAGGSEKKPLYTFDPHSSPSGIVFLGDDFPAPYRGGYFVARFGNLLDKPRVGFDVLHVALSKGDGGEVQARVKTLLSPIARPVDLHLSGKGKVCICEYSRQIENKGFNGMLPGRVLELAVKEKE